MKSVAAQPRKKAVESTETDMALMPISQPALALSALAQSDREFVAVRKQRESRLKNVFRKGQIEIDSLEEINAEKGREGAEEPEKPVKTYKAETLGLISMILGLSNLILMFVPILGIVCSVVSFVFGIKALKTNDKRAVFYGVIGILLACLTFLFAALWSTLIIWTIISAAVLI